jgi:hypothetical protein
MKTEFSQKSRPTKSVAKCRERLSGATQLLFDDYEQHLGRQGAPDLCLDCVFAGTQKPLDAEVLLDPLEEQLHLPTTFVHRSDCQRRQCRVVGQKDQSLARVRILEPDTLQMLRIIPWQRKNR